MSSVLKIAFSIAVACRSKKGVTGIHMSLCLNVSINVELPYVECIEDGVTGIHEFTCINTSIDAELPYVECAEDDFLSAAAACRSKKAATSIHMYFYVQIHL